MGFGGLWRALAGFSGLYRVLSGFIRFYRVLSGFIGFWWVLSGFMLRFFLVSSTPGAGAGGCRNRRTKTHAHETTHITRRAVGSHDVAVDGSLVTCPPVRQPQSTVYYFQLNHCSCDDQVACARLTASAASAVVVRGGGLIGGHDFSHDDPSREPCVRSRTQGRPLPHHDDRFLFVFGCRPLRCSHAD